MGCPAHRARLKEKTISRKGRETDQWYSGKAHGFGGNIQALFTPGGIPLWASPVLPGGAHDIIAAREHVPPVLRPYLKDQPVLADSGYEGAGIGVHVPVKKPAGGREIDLNNQTRNALLRSLRCLGERGFALMSQRWRTLQRSEPPRSPGRGSRLNLWHDAAQSRKRGTRGALPHWLAGVAVLCTVGMGAAHRAW